MTHHHLHSSPETCHWGFFEAKLKPVLTIASGDEVTIDTISGGPEVVPDRSRFHVPPELAEVHAKSERMVPGHILTGPVAVAGADGRPAAMGARPAAGAVFRRNGRSAAAGVGPHHLADPPRDGRQPRQQG